ncbi:hypothetical protein HNQ74_000510 [Bartonella doshiae]|uniref:Uncharacterized protein n=2 Tax=Bartonella doshiae TaxID=33044 RepID=A0A380ZDM6_BARDO|nr:hypothetical protein MCS_00526 [Bartonella doshiae NCTC 12862 = ATCC 700133]MBB6159097.1 hypothetical protein [Bartonella doshiae]SUV44474.1 Uncharacterised protein [Bartonella doshiae]
MFLQNTSLNTVGKSITEIYLSVDNENFFAV